MSDIDTSTAVLALIRHALSGAAARLDTLAAALPALPDAGDATADIAEILAELLHRAGEIGTGSHAATQVMDLTRAAYAETETRIAQVLATGES